ncbi:MAG: hypothetical protein K2N43_00335 [Lachnospiraceae bacterium]|nr:hypothetical protein [Lachnospiraceae bacterium]
MIHNIGEEREKLNRRESSLSDPFTDEELMRLIGQVEERALIHAPGHLKDTIFFQLDEERQKRKRRQLFSYRAKVLVGMAAALAVLFLVPMDRTETADAPQTGILDWMNEETEGPDAWEQEALDRQRDIDRTWERYQKGQERADARKQYFENMTDKLTDYGIWED